MCTCIQLKTKDSYFGRNLDLEYRFGEKVVITPRNYCFSLRNKDILKTKYAMIGMATVFQNYPLYAEAVNEKGLAMAGLYFPENAKYFESKERQINLAPFELIPYFLGKFETIAEVKEELKKINITNESFSSDMPLADLHWMISDKETSIVVEQTIEGLKVYDNPIGVLTNNPPFSYHMMNLNNYLNLSPYNQENQFSRKVSLNTYGQGMGAIGLPGDNSPSSRFIRCAFYKLNSICADNEEESVVQFFHILESVLMVKGSVITKSGKCDITTYSSCMNQEHGIYYYKTYYNPQICMVKMREEEKNKTDLTVYNLMEKPSFQLINDK